MKQNRVDQFFFRKILPKKSEKRFKQIKSRD